MFTFGQMQVNTTPIEGLLVLEPRVFSDDRGWFMESWNRRKLWEATGIEEDWVQDNESCSAKGVLRGLHLQVPPYAQAKLVRVSYGAVFDVAVDLRKGSPTFGKWFGIELNAENKKQLFIPAGFAHGFQVLEDNTIFSYKCSAFYHKDSERILAWNDPEIGVNWPIEQPLLSDRDQNGAPLSSFNSEL